MIPQAPSRLDDATLTELLRKARTIAVVGLSPKPHRDSHRVAAYLQRAGYLIIPVTPKQGEILGETPVPELGAIAGPVDIVDVFRRPEFVPPIAEQAAAIGAGLLFLQEGITSAEARATAKGAGMAFMEDSCLMVQHSRLLGRPG